MNCNISEQCMMRYFDSGLNDIEAAQFRQHLKSCDKCRTDFESMKEIFNNIEDDIVIEPPEDFERQVMQKIDLVEAERKKKSGRFIAFLYSFTALVMIALTAFLIADLKGMNTSGINVNDSLGSASGLFSGVSGAAQELLNILAGAMAAFFHIMFVVIKTYYYVFIMLAVVLFAIEWMFVSLVKRNYGGMTR